ncbi:MAG: hypothetical protein EHM70_17410 [Chloroflexota bacterium]|nr:MAG: hypothetical protein EHM70_17410 [Chloroflexota bacterium]
MIRKPLLAAVMVLALVTMACGINFNLPVREIKTGPTVTEDLMVPLLEDSTAIADVTLSFGAGEMTLSGGAEDALITGTILYNVADFKPDVTTVGDNVEVEQGNLNIQGIPDFDENIKNEWDLKFGSAPMRLQINAGAYNGDFDFGGLSLHDLEISDGASDVDVDFSEPNPVEMDVFQYSTGASDINIKNLANANFDTMIFRCGAGSYTLDFSGELQRDATVTIESGISNIEIIVPEGVSARVTFEGGLSNVDADGEWDRSGNDYTMSGEGPTINIIVTLGAGNLQLRNR